VLDRLGTVISRHPWTVCGLWLAAFLLAVYGALLGGFGQGLFDRLSTGGGTVPGPAKEGTALLTRTADNGPTVLLLVDDVAVTSTPLREQLGAARRDVRRIPNVVTTDDPFARNSFIYDVDSIPYIAEDQNAVLMTVTLRRGMAPEEQAATIERVSDRLRQVGPNVPGSRAIVGGLETIVEEVTHQAEVDLRTGEGIALPVSLVIMLVVFGGFLAAGLPIIGAIASIAGAMATLMGFSYLMALDVSTVNVVTVLGLGLCIDYGLLLVSRYREEMRLLPGDPALPPTRRQRELALRRTMDSAGRTVLFSGITVAVSLSGLLVFEGDFLRAIGAAGVSIVVVALLVALTLVPALLAVVRVRMIRPGITYRIPGLRRIVRKLGDVAPEDGVFSRLARVVQRHPALVLISVAAALFVCSMPVLRMHPVVSGTGLLPADSSQRQLFEAVSTRFPYAAPPPIQVAVDARVRELCPSNSRAPSVPGSTTPTCPFARAISTIPGVVRVEGPFEQGDDARGYATVLNVRVAGTEASHTAKAVVASIRQINPGFPAYTTGPASALVDLLHDLRSNAPLAVLIVVLATFVLLFLMTGSVLVPFKALFMNVISLGASLGVVVWVFQDGIGEGLLGFASPGGVEVAIPPLALAFGFGLAMDYEVFLLARIAEFRREGLSNDKAVVMGLQRSGRIITSAALIIVVVFAGFVAGKLLVIKETGVALAVAVAIDATLVRMLLVPATMTLLGEWNWWAPAPLRRLHERFGLEEHRPQPQAVALTRPPRSETSGASGASGAGRTAASASEPPVAPHSAP
jgi:RND superfamily putative drug exporter